MKCTILALHLHYSGCCVWSLSPTCRNNQCYCDKACYIFRDCCSDVANIGCHPTSPTPTPTDAFGRDKPKICVIQ